MKIDFKERKYKFTNGCILEVYPSEIHDISIAHLYNVTGDILMSTETKPITNRMGIVKHIETTCKTNLEICAESLSYNITDALIDDICFNLEAVVTPRHQASYANILIRLFIYSPQTDYNNCLYSYYTRTSFTAYKEIETAIKEAVKRCDTQMRNNRIYRYECPKLDKRFFYFNNRQIKVEVSDINNLQINNLQKIENIIIYNPEGILYRDKDNNIELYERKEILKKVISILTHYGIDIQGMDGEECEYIHEIYGLFRVSPLKNNKINIRTVGVFDLQKNIDIGYNDYDKIIACIKGMVEKIEKNPLKYKRKQSKSYSKNFIK